jgi:hypothetical protein
LIQIDAPLGPGSSGGALLNTKGNIIGLVTAVFNNKDQPLGVGFAIPVQDLKKGDLIKTLLHEYKPIFMIGKKDIYHPATEERIKDQLYQCSQNEYPEIFEPLIITGCHSILVDDFKDLMKEIDKELGMPHEVSYMDNHIKVIKSYLPQEFGLDVSGLPNFLNEPTGKLSVNKEATYGFAAVEDQQILIGPAMIPGKLIPRKDENGDTYFVYFTKDTIKKIAYKAMKDKIIDRVNIEHNSGELVDDVYLIESWIVINPATDKSREYGLNPTEGTWMVMYKVDNLDVWQGYVVPGLIRGFSIEGYFTEELIK